MSLDLLSFFQKLCENKEAFVKIEATFGPLVLVCKKHIHRQEEERVQTCSALENIFFIY
jgi:hypothetical protein